MNKHIYLQRNDIVNCKIIFFHNFRMNNWIRTVTVKVLNKKKSNTELQIYHAYIINNNNDNMKIIISDKINITMR